MTFQDAVASARSAFFRTQKIDILRVGLWGTVALLAVLLVLTWRSPAGKPAASIELVSEAVQPPPADAPTPIVSSQGRPDISQLNLRGVLSTGAVFGFADGRQRFVTAGREILPGIHLVSVHRQFVTIDQGGSQARLPLEGASVAAETSSGPAPTVSSSGRSFTTTPAANHQRQVLDLRLGMEPEMEGDRIIGFRMKPDASLPFLSTAGLRPGDVIISLNNEPVRSTERLMELPAEIEAIRIANIAPPTIQYLRGGKIVNARLD